MHLTEFNPNFTYIMKYYFTDWLKIFICKSISIYLHFTGMGESNN
jgi:hypothetical protein